MEANTQAQPVLSQPVAMTPSLFQSFNNYPWIKDRQFLQGLAAMLGQLMPSTDMAKATAISLQARIWWFSSKQGIVISPESYAAHQASHPDAATPEPAILARIEDVQRRMGMTSVSVMPSWQVHAPKADLRVKADDMPDYGVAGVGADGDAPYPENFKAVIEAVTTGKTVAGIKEIPNTVVRLPGITPVGRMQAPRKPWEKDATTGQVEGGSTSLPPAFLDQEFPPIEEDEMAEDTKSEGVAALVGTSGQNSID